MENTNEQLEKIFKELLEIKAKTTDEVLENATKEQLEKYIQLSEDIEAKLKILLEK